MLQKSDIPDTEKNNPEVKQTNDDGSVMLSSYAGAKGENHFVVRPSSDGQITIEATYGTLDGGTFTPLEDQSQYGPSTVVVTK